jgi:hypothetical protein
MSDQKQIDNLKRYISSAEESIAAAKEILSKLTASDLGDMKASKTEYKVSASSDGKIIEGVFNGEDMIGPSGKIFPVPANYASKSKLIDGDRLKLTVAEDGSFIFKQIGPAERKKLIGTLNFTDNSYHVLSEGKTYNLLYASVTYFKAKPGDRVTIVVPKESDSVWAALENVIHDQKDEVLLPEDSEIQELTEPESQEKGEDILTQFGLEDTKEPELKKLEEPYEIKEEITETTPQESTEIPINTSVAPEPLTTPSIPTTETVLNQAEATLPADLPEQVIMPETETPITADPITEALSQPSATPVSQVITEPLPTLTENAVIAPASGGAMPEESFLPRTQDDGANALGEVAPTENAGAVDPGLSELDI